MQRKGGLQSFTTLPSLQQSLALADVIDSSARASRPRFDSIWSVEYYRKALEPTLTRLAEDPEATAFAKVIPGGLPCEARATFQLLGDLDKMLDDFAVRTVTQSEEFSISIMGQAVQHRLLSLPPGSQLSQSGKSSTLIEAYDSCRLAAMIYSNSTIFPISPADDWLEKLLPQLKSVVQKCEEVMSAPENLPLAVWTLTIASIASYPTRHRDFYLHRLRSLLIAFRLTSWSAVRSILVNFLWRDSSCGRGGMMIWRALDVESLDV